MPEPRTERDLRPLVYFIRNFARHGSNGLHRQRRRRHRLFRNHPADERCHFRLRMIKKTEEVLAGQIEGVRVFAMKDSMFSAGGLHGHHGPVQSLDDGRPAVAIAKL